MRDAAPEPREPVDCPGFLRGGGRATQLILARDWRKHPLGLPETWPEGLKTALSLILNSPESMILAWDCADLHFFFNEAYAPLLGPRIEWAMGAQFDRVWADAWEQARPIIDEAFAGKAKRFHDLPWRLGNDRGATDTFWTFSYSRILDPDGEAAGLFIFTNETTTRVLADRALAESQAALRQLNENLERRVEERTAERDMMWSRALDLMVVMSPDGVYRSVNPAWTTVLGYPIEELIGVYGPDLAHPDDLEATRGALAIVQTGDLPSFEFRMRHKDGGYRWIQWNARSQRGGIFATGRDVTAAKEAEQRLRDTEAQLRQAQKMEAVGQLTGGLAHDFNNLLAGISGSLELIGVRLEQGRGKDVERFRAAAMEATRRAAALTHRLLAFSRRQTLAPKATDVNGMVRGMLDMIRRTVGPSVQVDTALPKSLWTVLVDQPQLENALLNLCINARDAMPGGGRIAIETANRTVDRRTAKPNGLPEGQYLSLSVTDTGQGMTPEVMAKAFEPFFTTKPIGQGTGLGLSMIYGFAKQSGGQVRIHSTVGTGTNVSIYLPRHLGEAEEDAPRPLAAAPRALEGETVLVVDDEPIVRMLVREVLDDLGYVAIEAADGAGGLKELQSEMRIDLLVTDVGLPGGMNGRQLADAAWRDRPDLKVLFITGFAETALLDQRKIGSGASVLTKPFAVEALASRLRELLGK